MADETTVPTVPPIEDDIDACDRPTDNADSTPDEDLPAATGGVA